jgi:hypothetical protein
MYIRTSEAPGQELKPRIHGFTGSYIGEPKLLTKAECPAYETGEIQKSRTEQGHLPFDVMPHPRGLLIADFGVDWRHVKESTKKEKLLKDWLTATKSDLYSIFLRIYGYSDCVGNEKNNMYLRRERAKRVHVLLDKDLQSRIDFVGPARAGEYVTDNGTVEGRAKNRGVIIELFRLAKETIEITEPAPSKKISKGWKLVGETVDYWNVREAPNGKILGSMTGTPTPVTVEDKAYVGGKRWYQIVLHSRMKLIRDIELRTFPVRQKWNLCEFAAFSPGNRGSVFDLPEVKRNEIELPAGTRCWVNESGVVNTAEWGLFRRELRDFEAANKSLNLDARITMLRQMGQPSDLPFDYIIGTAKGKLYFENHPFVKDEWQILRDYQKVRMPDGRDIDIYHLFVGLDVLTKKKRSVTFFTIDLGPNYSAATWAGDIGAGAADATISKLAKTFRDCWANLNPNATDNERLEHYYNTRAPESDLLGDIDVWGVHALRGGKMDTIEKLLTAYYEDIYDGSQRVLTTKRKNAIEWFLSQYGFKYDQTRDLAKWPSALLDQQRVAMRRAEFSVEHHINQFALIWMLRKIWRKVPNYKGVKPDNYFVSGMTAKFLQWLEYQAIENGAVV